MRNKTHVTEAELGKVVKEYRPGFWKPVRETLLWLVMGWGVGGYAAVTRLEHLTGIDSMFHDEAITLVAIACLLLYPPIRLFLTSFHRVSYTLHESGLQMSYQGKRPKLIPFNLVKDMNVSNQGRYYLSIVLAPFRVVYVMNWTNPADGDPVKEIFNQYQNWKSKQGGNAKE